MIDRPLAYEAMDPQVKLLWESQAQTQLLGEIIELLTPPQSEIEPESVEVSESEVEPSPEAVPVTTSKRAGLLARLMGHD